MVAQSKHVIGKTLWICKDFKANPLKWNPQLPQSAGRILRMNFASLKRIYSKYPELKPVRVKQLNLFD